MTHSRRILVVDDEVNARTALAELLRDEGFTVETAADAFKALGKYETFASHVVVTDLQMPGMNGVDLLRKIAAMEAPAPVIMMTAFGEVNTAVEAMRAGATDYLTKPIKLHCAALAESLLESELFGHEKGSFTGAMARKQGRFELANGGTLFLDEIGEISPAIQVKLLRFLQELEFERVGGTQTVRVDVRVVAATNRDLLVEIAKGRFREDLYYRLNVVALDMPSLRQRKSDIPALVNFFIHRYANENGKVIEGCSPDAIERLVGYNWPGNVRELENAIERAVVLATGPTIELKHLAPTVNPVAMEGMPIIPGAKMDDLERYATLETLKATGGSTSRAAEILGVSTRTIQYRLHQYNAAPHSALDVVRRSESDLPPKS